MSCNRKLGKKNIPRQDNLKDVKIYRLDLFTKWKVFHQNVKKYNKKKDKEIIVKEMFVLAELDDLESIATDRKRERYSILKSSLFNKETEDFVEKWYADDLVYLIKKVAYKFARRIKGTYNIVRMSDKNRKRTENITKLNLDKFSFNMRTLVTICEKDDIIGYSICSPEDIVYYKRKLGYKKAMERLFWGINAKRTVKERVIQGKYEKDKKSQINGVIDKDRIVGVLLAH